MSDADTTTAGASAPVTPESLHDTRPWWVAAGILHGLPTCSVLASTAWPFGGGPGRQTTEHHRWVEVLAGEVPHVVCVCASSPHVERCRHEALPVDAELLALGGIDAVRLDMELARRRPSYAACTEVRKALVLGPSLPPALADEASALLEEVTAAVVAAAPWNVRARQLIATMADGGGSHMVYVANQALWAQSHDLHRQVMGHKAYDHLGLCRNEWVAALAATGSITEARMAVVSGPHNLDADLTTPPQRRGPARTDMAGVFEAKARRAEALRSLERWLDVVETGYASLEDRIVFVRDWSRWAAGTGHDSLLHEAMARGQVELVGRGHHAFIRFHPVLCDALGAEKRVPVVHAIPGPAEAVPERWRSVAEIAFALREAESGPDDDAARMAENWRVATAALR